MSWEDEDGWEGLAAAAAAAVEGGMFARLRLLLLLFLLLSLWRKTGWKDESRRMTMPEATSGSARQWT